LNPAWEFVQRETSWTMRRIDHIEWLPTGTRTPFAMMSAWRQIMIWAAPFLLACSLWVGLTRRRSATLLISAVIVNLTLFSGLALAQRMTGTRKIFWSIDSANEFLGTFVYRNHGAAFMNLGVALTVAFG